MDWRSTRPLLTLAATTFVVLGCYRSHARSTDGGAPIRDGGVVDGRLRVPDAHRSDVGVDAPWDAGRCAEESCEGTDEDCDGVIDEGVCEAHALAITVGGGMIRDAACMLARNGRIACWGWNGDGMVDPSLRSAGIPHARWLAGVEDGRSVEVGGYVACALTESREVRCWGSSVGSDRGAVVGPTAIGALAGATDLAVAVSGFCGVVGGAVLCDDQVRVSEPPRERPIGAVAGIVDAIAVDISPWNAFVIEAGGTVRGWGLNYVGELGDGTTERSDALVSIGTDAAVAEVCTGGYLSCARHVDGGVSCWGAGTFMRDGTPLERTRPVRLALENVVAVTCGDGYACSADRDGAAYCWGYNAAGQLGDGTREYRATPVRVPIDDVVDIDAGSTTTCAVRRDGSAWCWGDNHNGSVGDGTTDGDLTDGWTWPRLHPTRVLVP